MNLFWQHQLSQVVSRTCVWSQSPAPLQSPMAVDNCGFRSYWHIHLRSPDLAQVLYAKETPAFLTKNHFNTTCLIPTSLWVVKQFLKKKTCTISTKHQHFKHIQTGHVHHVLLIRCVFLQQRKHRNSWQIPRAPGNLSWSTPYEGPHQNTHILSFGAKGASPEN